MSQEPAAAGGGAAGKRGGRRALAFDPTLAATPNPAATPPQGTGRSAPRTVERLRQHEEEREREERRRSLRLAMLIFLAIWPTFLLLDVLMGRVVVPEAQDRLFWFVLWRAVGEVSVAVWLPLVARPGVSARRLLVVETMAMAVPVLCVALLALPLGGPASIYQHGISLMFLVRLSLMAMPWRRSLPMTAAHVCLFPGMMIAASLVDRDVAAILGSGAGIAAFGANYFFVVVSAGLGVFVSHSVWALRRQVFEARKLGRYRLKAPIGSGGMGEVWLAWDESLRRDVALKLLRVGAGGAVDVGRFEREARAAGRLRSPHTIQIYDFGASDDGVWYMAMELLVGSDLRALVEASGPLPEARTVHFARQACLSLAEAHGAGVIHRDVKPDNIFVGRAGEASDQIKLLDFGIAKVTDAAEPDVTATQPGFIGGTPTYMAPETCAGRPADARSDLYSLGATLYYMLAGRPPHLGASAGELLAAHLSVDPAPPSTHRAAPITPALEALVMRCLAKRPEERFASARELADALAAVTCADRWDDEDARRFWAVTFP